MSQAEQKVRERASQGKRKVKRRTGVQLKPSDAPKSEKYTESNIADDVLSQEDEDKIEALQPEHQAQPSQDVAKEDFETFYLRNVTVELADDLDKVRAAGDFTEEKLGILIQALKQGSDSLGSEERSLRVGR